jgi:fucose permease
VNQTRSTFANNPHAVFWLAYPGFFLVGILNTFLGPLLPLLSARWQLTDAQAGYLFTAQALGIMLASAANGWLVARLGTRPIITGGFVLAALSAGLFAAYSWSFGLVLLFLSGLALGSLMPTITVLIAAAGQERQAQALIWLNFFWGLGAVAAPLLCAGLVQLAGLPGALAAIAAAALFFGLTVRFALRETNLAARQDEATPAIALRPFLPVLLIYGCLTFAYIGCEATLGGWITSYAQRQAGQAAGSWSIAATLFWAGLLAGRAFSPLLLRKINEISLILLGLAIAFAGQLILLRGGSGQRVNLGAGLAGLGLAAVFPTVLALFTARTGAASPKLTGVLYFCAGLSGAVMPGLTGWLAENTRQLRLALFAPLVLSSLIPFLLFLARRDSA